MHSVLATPKMPSSTLKQRPCAVCSVWAENRKQAYVKETKPNQTETIKMQASKF